MSAKLLTEYHLEFLSLKGGCRYSLESTHVKMPHCWKSHALAQLFEVIGVRHWLDAKRRFQYVHYYHLVNENWEPIDAK